MTEATAETIAEELRDKSGVTHVREVNENVVSFRIKEGHKIDMPEYEYWYVTDIDYHSNIPVQVSMVQIK